MKMLETYFETGQDKPISPRPSQFIICSHPPHQHYRPMTYAVENGPLKISVLECNFDLFLLKLQSKGVLRHEDVCGSGGKTPFLNSALYRSD
jgi:hypothetical protein